MSNYMNPLPPQAYTKETLVHAYAWLQSQSENIKELATTPDVLVSLYLKAKLQGNGALERPSIQNFKNELKNLAGMIGEFEVLEAPGGSHASGGNQTIRIRSQDLRAQNASSASPLISNEPSPLAPSPNYSSGQYPNSSSAPPSASVSQSKTYASSSSYSAYQANESASLAPGSSASAANNPQTPPIPSGSSYKESSLQLKFEERAMTQPAPTFAEMLDSRSMDMIQEVKIQFNLSTDSEALRLLLANGYNQIKGLLK